MEIYSPLKQKDISDGISWSFSQWRQGTQVPLQNLEKIQPYCTI